MRVEEERGECGGSDYTIVRTFCNVEVFNRVESMRRVSNSNRIDGGNRRPCETKERLKRIQVLFMF
jgi:hypothetical protein